MNHPGLISVDGCMSEVGSFLVCSSFFFSLFKLYLSQHFIAIIILYLYFYSFQEITFLIFADSLVFVFLIPYVYAHLIIVLENAQYKY